MNTRHALVLGIALALVPWPPDVALAQRSRHTAPLASQAPALASLLKPDLTCSVAAVMQPMTTTPSHPNQPYFSGPAQPIVGPTVLKGPYDAVGAEYWVTNKGGALADDARIEIIGKPWANVNPMEASNIIYVKSLGIFNGDVPPGSTFHSWSHGFWVIQLAPGESKTFTVEAKVYHPQEKEETRGDNSCSVSFTLQRGW